MVRRVVRVRLPVVKEYDVVFDDDAAVFVVAVIRQPATARGPRAGQVVDTHRTSWGARGSGSRQAVREILETAQRDLTDGTAVITTTVPAQLDWVHEERLVGRPHDSVTQAVHLKRRAAARG